MELNEARCYQAMLSRDRRFDGRFYIAVVTTGVYCRPICPARKPRRENVRFFACAAAAELAGFRPCRRCRPESSPGTPAWTGTAATVGRALRLIADGALDRGGVDELARRLGLGARQLRRLFLEHLGAPPRAIAQTRRAHFARKLLDETGLPVAEVAFSSGFSSLRQFNATVRATFGKPPTALRQGARETRTATGSLRLRLPYRPPLAWESLLAFLRARAIPGVESVDDRSYRRTVKIGEASGMIEVEPIPDQICLELRIQLPEPAALREIVERTREVLDLNADPLPIGTHLERDPLLAPVLARLPGLRVPGAWDGFETAVRAILGQQISVRGATTLSGRLVQAFGEPIPDACRSQGLTHHFPGPERLAAGEWPRAIGMPRTRAEAIRALAAAVASGERLLDGSAGLDEAIARLLEVPGIGKWTAQYIAMRVLREPDAFPASDLGLRRALAAAGGDRLPTPAAVSERAESWRPWRAYAAMALWMKDQPASDALEAGREKKRRKK